MNIEDKLVRVEWVDSSTASSWTLMEDFKDEQHDPIKIVSYGIIVKETDDSLVIAQNYGSNPPQIYNTTAIPKGCIIKQKIIKSEDKMEAVVDKNTYTIKNTPNCGISVYNEELKDSEDEKIKKAIKYCIKQGFIGHGKIENVTPDECLAWLEKQAPKPKWSDEDEIGSDATIELLEYFINYAPEFRKPTIRRSIDWLKSLKKRMEE